MTAPDRMDDAAIDAALHAAIEANPGKEHARQVRAHMDKLGGKAYWGQLAESPELVVMFRNHGEKAGTSIIRCGGGWIASTASSRP